MRKILDFLDRIGNPKLFFISITCYIFCFIALPVVSNLINFSGGLDLKGWYTVESAYNLLGNLGEHGRKSYFVFFVFDYFYLISYSFFLSISISGLFKIINPAVEYVKFIALIPFLSGLFDLLENIFVSVMLANYPQKLITLTKFCTVFTLVKSVAFIACFVIIFVELVIIGMRRIQKR